MICAVRTYIYLTRISSQTDIGVSKESWNRLLPGIFFDVGVSHHPYLDLTDGARGSMVEVEGSDSTKYGKSFLSAGGGLSIRYEQLNHFRFVC